MAQRKVIKARDNSAAPAGGSVSPRRRLGGGGRVMRQDIVEARDEANEIRQNAHQDAERIRAEAEDYRQQGYEDGRAVGVEEGKREWTEGVLRMNRENEARFRHFEYDLVKLSLAIAEKIVGEAIRLEPKTISDIVTKAIHAVRHQKEIFLRVNPEDYDIISQEKYLLIEQLSRASDIDIRPDPGIARGGCLIESETGSIDASLEKQMAAIEKILLGD